MKISDSQIKQLSGKSILITGGTGSFGSRSPMLSKERI